MLNIEIPNSNSLDSRSIVWFLKMACPLAKVLLMLGLFLLKIVIDYNTEKAKRSEKTKTVQNTPMQE